MALVIKYQKFQRSSLRSKRTDHNGILIWAVKIDDSFSWFEGEPPAPSDLHNIFVDHLPQLSAQVAYAKQQFQSNPIYTLLTVDVWFAFFHFPADSSTGFLDNQTIVIKDGRAVLGEKEYEELANFCIIVPTPMFDINIDAFYPDFLHVFQRFSSGLSDAFPVPHPLFLPSEGNILDSPLVQVNKDEFKTIMLDVAGKKELDLSFARGSEPPEARSPRDLSSDSNETDTEKQEFSTGIPSTPHYLTTSPPKTRLKSRLQEKERNELSLPGTSNPASNPIFGTCKDGNAPIGRDDASNPVTEARSPPRRRRRIDKNGRDSGKR